MVELSGEAAAPDDFLFAQTEVFLSEPEQVMVLRCQPF
jgi:hypothetical protein